ncbi:MAG: hypothetical protein HY706_06885 [Candidatus Hydrogenedentes bacterium]|nr:hypothetical protein [Candidatus Hydrogenedentota bacterium]
MIGVQDFNGHYDWTFEYIRRTFGEKALREYWSEAISFDSQRHAFELMRDKGFVGMDEYWAHTLTQEEAGYSLTRTEDVFRIDMHDCPSKGYLIEHGLAAYEDYCEHCMGWIGPLAQAAGFTVDHEHNHCGQCWWELRKKGSTRHSDEARKNAGEQNVELSRHWPQGEHHHFEDCRRTQE